MNNKVQGNECKNGNGNKNKINYHSRINTPVFMDLPINTGSGGQFFCYDIMLKKIYDLMTAMVSRHNKVLFIRFDLRFPKNYSTDISNDKVSLLVKNLKEFYTYHAIDIQSAWVREQSREKHQHYHCLVLMDGNKVQRYHPVLSHVSGVWGRILQCDPVGLVDYCNHDRSGNPVQNGIMIRRPSSKAVGEKLEKQTQQFQEDFARAFQWASYLCKENQKMNTPPNMRRFGVSQLTKSQNFIAV